MSRLGAVGLLLTLCAGCANARLYEIRITDPVDPVAFAASLDAFLSTQGLRPYQSYQSTSAAQPGVPHWVSDRPFLNVRLDPPYNPIVINVGGATSRPQLKDALAREIEAWVHRSYPDVHVQTKTIDYFNPT
jgi:hypothetical protein